MALHHNTTHGEGSTRNGKKLSPEYRAWSYMLSRCYNKNVKSYPRYGGRGITVCKRWRDSYAAFLKDMGRKPSSQHSLEREKNDDGYTPENTAWATKQEQARNTLNVENAQRLTLSLTVLQWSELLGLDRAVIHGRLHNGWSDSKALLTPILKIYKKRKS